MRVVEPAHDGIAREVNHAPAVTLHFGDERVVDAAEVFGHFLGAAPRAQHFTQGFRQRGEARNIGKERGSGGAVWQGLLAQ